MRLADYAQFRIPPGFRDAVAALAREEGVSTSEFTFNPCGRIVCAPAGS